MKSFTIESSEKKQLEFSLDFTLPGSDEVKHEVFHAVPEVGGTTILDLVGSGSLESSYQANAIRKFLHQAIVEGEREQFFKLLDESNPPVSLKKLTDIVNWLVEEYGENPTSPASQS